ncbi:transcription factor HES-5-like, partial [Clarias magur]
MAPAITSGLTFSNEHLPLNNKMRKPIVEKKCRDHINSSIEQLKSLPVPEFLNQQPDSKLEKADILEMTVSFLRQKQQQPPFSNSSSAVNQGFSRCVHEVVHFLSKEEVKKKSQRKLLNHFKNVQLSSNENKRESVLPQLIATEQQINSKEKCSVRNVIWRPWVTTFPDSQSVAPHPSTCSPETWTLSSAKRPLSMWQPYIPHCVSKLSHWLQTVRNSNKPKTHTFIWRFESINRGDTASTNHTHSTQRELQHRDTAITSSLTISNEHLPLNNKMRKPMVEKMRRDCINSSIEHLKSLLAPEFLNQQPDSKLEKADILEMAVSFLRQQQQQQSAFSTSSAAVEQDFFRCVHDVVHFLSKEEVKTQSQRKLLKHFQNLQPSSDENRKESILPQL